LDTAHPRSPGVPSERSERDVESVTIEVSRRSVDPATPFALRPVRKFLPLWRVEFGAPIVNRPSGACRANRTNVRGDAIVGMVDLVNFQLTIDYPSN
jgi:hypothetical protein